MNNKIMLVDDEEKIVSALKMSLEDDYEVHIAHSGKAALQKINDHGPFAVVVSDFRMPVADGGEFLQKVKEISPQTVRMILTGYADVKIAIELINKGQIFRFLTKPCSLDDLKIAVDAALQQHQLLTVEKDMLHRTVCGTIELLTEIMNLLDPIGFSQVPQKKELVIKLCANLGVRDPLNVVLATMLSSIGAPTIPAPVLLRIRAAMERSPQDEYVLDQMCEVGGQLLRKIPRLEGVARIIECQRYHASDAGEGAADQVPFGAKILKVVNDFTALRLSGVDEFGALACMSKKSQAYDGDVLRELHNLFHENTAVNRPRPTEQPVSVDELTVGQILARDAVTLDGVLVVPAETLIGTTARSKIVNYSRLIGLNVPLYVRVGQEFLETGRAT